MQRQSMTSEIVHRHEKLAPESGIKFMVMVSGACVKGLKYKFMVNKSAHIINDLACGFKATNNK